MIWEDGKASFADWGELHAGDSRSDGRGGLGVTDFGICCGVGCG